LSIVYRDGVVLWLSVSPASSVSVHCDTARQPRSSTMQPWNWGNKDIYIYNFGYQRANNMTLISLVQLHVHKHPET